MDDNSVKQWRPEEIHLFSNSDRRIQRLSLAKSQQFSLYLLARPCCNSIPISRSASSNNTQSLEALIHKMSSFQSHI